MVPFGSVMRTAIFHATRDNAEKQHQKNEQTSCLGELLHHPGEADHKQIADEQSDDESNKQYHDECPRSVLTM